MPTAATVLVNGGVVGTATPGEAFAFKVTHELQPRNELVIEAATDGPIGDVTLEIR
ncbi:hypothetical protein FRUB_07228 [Fimbriiglobus ruber]|uniref:Uncharacterized protein n=1 Tax=Fimbriiglobus ruber TaxID=1908690 RepID=A0A225DHT9_9BACT|nr:hypothetical protein FRUB_07228 [Fimbriiglobus ruber]